MKIFLLNKKDEFKHTVAVFDSYELRIVIAESIAEKLGIDLNDEKNSFHYTNIENLKHLYTCEFEAIAVAIHFIEKTDSHA